MKLISYLKKLRIVINKITNLSIESEQQLLILGRLLSETVKSKKHIASLNKAEFKVFSQWSTMGLFNGS